MTDNILFVPIMDRKGNGKFLWLSYNFWNVYIIDTPLSKASK
jgi:hypothetical protein